MVEPHDMIVPEIAEEYGRTEETIRKGENWSQHPAWPAPLPGRRGRYKRYARSDIEKFVRDHVEREEVHLVADHLYTAEEIAKHSGAPSASAIRSELAVGRWPAPDYTERGRNEWLGSTVNRALNSRRGYRRRTDDSGDAE